MEFKKSTKGDKKCENADSAVSVLNSATTFFFLAVFKSKHLAHSGDGCCGFLFL